jgi:oligoribonuclease
MAEFIWLDLETTGLDPDREIILEIGVIIANDSKGDDFTEVAAEQTVITPYDFGGRVAQTILDEMHPRVSDMHTKNGLLEELEDPSLCCTIEEADTYFAALVPDGLPSIAGNSVGSFDLQFLRKHMPKFAARLSHRVYDVSTLIRAERTYGDSAAMVETKADAHRALADVRASLATARAFVARRY